MTDLSLRPAARPMPAFALLDLVLPLAGIAIFALQLSGPSGPDVAWLTTVSERILDGQQLYAQILESNPPVAGFLYMLPVLAGRLLGIAPDPLIVIQTMAAALGSVLYAARLVRQHGLMAEPRSFVPLAFLLVACAWGMDFAQREHYVTMALLPVAVGLAVRAKGDRLPATTVLLLGVLAGFAACTKPYFVLPLVVAALLYALRMRSIRPLFWPEFLVAAAIFLAYWTWTALAFPAYFGVLVPKLAVAYVPDRREFWMLFLNTPAVGYVSIAVVAALTGRRHLKASPLYPALVVMSAGLMLSYLVQTKGYFYQAMPAFAFLALGYLLAFGAANRDSSRVFDKVLPLGLALFFAVLPVNEELQIWRQREPVVEALRAYGPGRTVAHISSDLGLANPAIRQAGDIFINSAPAMLTTLSAWRLRQNTHPTGATLAAIDFVEADERATLREDFKRTPPDLIVTTQDEFDWIAWAAKDPEFAAILDGYEKAREVPFFAISAAIFRRKGLPPES